MALTPLMAQYLATKRQYPDAVVFFRLGDFYEIFLDDAPPVAALLDLTLTAREGGDGKVPMCGVPYHAVQGYIARLVKAGKKVAICEQVEDPKTAKGLVKREVTRVVTPSTFIENDADASSPSLLGVCRGKTQWGLALLEPNTGAFSFWEESEETLADTLERLAASEIVTTKTLARTPVLASYCDARSGVVMTTLDDWQAAYDDSVSYIKAFFGLDSVRALELEETATSAVALVLRFLQSHLQTTLPHISIPRRYHVGTTMVLGPVVERSLELFRPANPDFRGKTLLEVLDETLTPMGGRLLRRWMQNPLLSLSEIVARHDAVEELTQRSSMLDALRSTLAPLRDLERLAARFSARVATPKDAAALRDSLAHLPALATVLAAATAPLLVMQWEQVSVDLSVLQATLQQALVDIPPLHGRDGGVIAQGYHEELDRLRSLASDAKQWLAQLQAREVARTGISSLKIGYTRVFGYYLEISNMHKAKVPTDYTRKQTLVNAERYVTPELKDYEEQILHAEERAIVLEQELFAQLCALALQHLHAVQAVAAAIAQVDVLSCFAWVAVRQQYVRPEMSEDLLLRITGGRHPVVEALLGRNKFVENDVELDREARQLILLTAPNMSGKSVYLRQTALIVLLAQMGSFVPGPIRLRWHCRPDFYSHRSFG